jgi:malonate-semialdehyde dehydrogenase (acetylating)/methylmalonate-semialdehyde dehydrogenase
MAIQLVDDMLETAEIEQTIHFAGGEPFSGTSTRRLCLHDPNTGQPRGSVPLANASDVDEVVKRAAQAQPAWAQVNPQRRARVLFEYKRLLESRSLMKIDSGRTIA